MDIAFTIIQLPFLALAAFLLLYVLIVTIAPFIVPRRRKSVPAGRKKFAIIIPAHNEEKVIERTLTSAKNIAYPNELYDVIVVADNCTDQTARVALANGAIVVERFDKSKRGKGYALNWVIPQVIERMQRYDACVFVDADSIISQNFLEEMNASLHAGHQVIQSSDLVLDNPSSWRVQLVLIAFALQNYVRPLGKSVLGLSIALKGNGMCFSTEILRTIRWDESSLGEDLDMGLELIRQGVKIHFNPRAVVYALMPTVSSSATSQRLRWEGGRFESIRTKVPDILRQAWRQKSIYVFEAAVDAAYPPLALFLMVVGGFIILNLGLITFGLLTTATLMWWWIAIVGGIALHCLLGMILARVHPRNLLAFLYVPSFLVWKISVYLKMLFKRGEKEWVRTAR